ncbi:MAG: YjfB family protein [Lachnospiraceae bacterium]|nr:YjfB family protein [Lachnospiraceae bacterium]
MDIAALSMAMSYSKTMSDIGVAVLSKNLDTIQDVGDAMLKTMQSAPVSELSVNPNVGGNIDIRV